MFNKGHIRIPVTPLYKLFKYAYLSLPLEARWLCRWLWEQYLQLCLVAWWWQLWTQQLWNTSWSVLATVHSCLQHCQNKTLIVQVQVKQ